MNTPALPLSGERKKPARRPRNDGIVKLARRERALYARIYKPGAKRAVYRSLHTSDVSAAESVFQHVRAETLRPPQPAPPNHEQPTFSL